LELGTVAELELGNCGWSWSGTHGAGELWLELEPNPRGTQVNIFASFDLLV